MTRLVFETKRMNVAELGGGVFGTDLFGELTTQNSLVFDLDEDDEIYEGYGKVNSAFPYRQLNGYTRELHEKDVRGGSGKRVFEGSISYGIWWKIVGAVG